MFTVLQYEPNHATAKEFYPLILEKIMKGKHKKTGTVLLDLVITIIRCCWETKDCVKKD